MTLRNTMIRALTAATVCLTAAAAQAAYIPVIGGLSYNAATGTGFPKAYLERGAINNTGTAVGFPEKHDGGTSLGLRAVRWDASGAMELGHLGTDTSGRTDARAVAINDACTAVGWADRYAGIRQVGVRAVRWDASGTVATELGGLGTNTSGYTVSRASAINDAGTAAGSARKYDGAGKHLGDRAVRWDASSTVATELGNLGTDASGGTFAEASAINDTGTAAGWARKYDGAGKHLGDRAVRWDASGTVATELGHLGTDAAGYTDAGVHAINDGGTAVGWAWRWSAGLGCRAVRWDASGTMATELGHLGTNASGSTSAEAFSINDAGTAVGYVSKYDATGKSLGLRAVRWNASDTAATELGVLGTDVSGYTYTRANSINAAGMTVGYAQAYDGAGLYLGRRAVLWNDGTVAVDLNTLIDPNSGWVLDRALAISDTGWVSGLGDFDPDGPGPVEPYRRLFTMQVPEPSSLGLLAIGALAGRWFSPTLFRRRR